MTPTCLDRCLDPLAYVWAGTATASRLPTWARSTFGSLTYRLDMTASAPASRRTCERTETPAAGCDRVGETDERVAHHPLTLVILST